MLMLRKDEFDLVDEFVEWLVRGVRKGEGEEKQAGLSSPYSANMISYHILGGVDLLPPLRSGGSPLHLLEVTFAGFLPQRLRHDR